MTAEEIGGMNFDGNSGVGENWNFHISIVSTIPSKSKMQHQPMLLVSCMKDG